MQRIEIAKDLDFSKIVYGWMNANQWSMSPAQVQERIEYCLEQGITTMDHADIYGGYTCEEIFGKGLSQKPTLRDQIELVSKCGIQLISENRPKTYIKHYNTTYEHIISSAESSLRNLQTSYLDLLLIHRPDPLMVYEEIARAYSDLHRDGKVKTFGVSNFTPWQFEGLQKVCDQKLVTNQVEISLLAPGVFEDGTMDQLRSRDIHPMAWSPLGGGSIFTLDDKTCQRIRSICNQYIEQGVAQSTDQILLAWLNHHPSQIMSVIGTGKTERIKSAAHSVHCHLEHQQWFELYEAARGHPIA
jgi:predicted oxidoreductase